MRDIGLITGLIIWIWWKSIFQFFQIRKKSFYLMTEVTPIPWEKDLYCPPQKRYVETAKGLRQYNFIEKSTDFVKGSLLKDEKGSTVYHTLMEKMILLSVVKVAALDLYGMGIEMEGGKPGWYDALNGLPGLLGSSMAETYELERLLEYLEAALQKYDKQVRLPAELDTLFMALVDSGKKYLKLGEKESLQSRDRITFWKERTNALESYREAVKFKMSGEERSYSSWILW